MNVDFHPRLPSTVDQPVVIAIAHDRKNLRAGVATLISVETSIGVKERLLNYVLGGVWVPAEKACGIVGSVEVRDDFLLEPDVQVVGTGQSTSRHTLMRPD